MRTDHRDVLTEAPPRERAARVRLLLAEGWSPSRILAEVPHLDPALVAGGDMSRDRRPITLDRPRRPEAN